MTFAMEDAPLPKMNDVLRAIAGVDVKQGELDVYGELKARRGEVEGYLKPLLVDVDVYDRAQDAQKGIGQQVYEGIVGGIGEAFRNRRKDDVATVVPLRGRLDDPNAGILATIGGILKNAFIKGIAPGLDKSG
jgi:hypothetical protein